MTRRVSHLLILGLLCGLPMLAGVGGVDLPSSAILGGGPPPARAAERVVPALRPAVQPQIQPPAAPAVVAPPVQPASHGAAPVEPVATPAPPPVVGPLARQPGQWVQAFRPTTLWASEKSDAANLGSQAQWAHFRVLGPPVVGRLPVEYPGDGATRFPQRGWLDGADVGPAGTPTPHHELAMGGAVNPISGLAAPRWIGQGWPQGVTAEFGALVDGDSGEVLWGRNADGQVAPASLTKIVTALVALDRAKLAERVDIKVNGFAMPGSTVMGLEPGENLSLETLLAGLMMHSGNDAGIAIAQHISGSEAAFAELMNAKTTELGLVNSRWVNSHGLDATGHYSSPYDLIAFSRYGMRNNPYFAYLCNLRRYEADGYIILNVNKLLGLYPKADGVKTGFTDGAGRAIVGTAPENGRRLYVALLRSANPAAEAQALLEWGFRSFAWQ